MASALSSSVKSLASALLLLPAVSLLPSSAQAQIQGPACRGTLLQLNVRESGESRTDRFRFNLGIEAEASTSAAALDQLRDRLARLREALEPLVMGRLVIPAPRTYAKSESQPMGFNGQSQRCPGSPRYAPKVPQCYPWGVYHARVPRANPGTGPGV